MIGNLIGKSGTRIMASTMNAIRVRSFGEPEVLRLESDVPVPTVGPNQVLIRLRAAGVNPVETYIRSGSHTTLPNLPYTPGGDGAGTIEAIGSLVSQKKNAPRVGQRVFTTMRNSGTYAEYATADDDRVFPLADRLTFGQGASIGVPYHTAYRALFQKNRSWSPKDTVLIHGASGAVGIAAVQMAVNKGMTVFGTAGTAEGLKLVLKNGAHKVFNHRDANYMQQIKAATNNGAGVDVIVEMLANVNLPADLDLLAKNGRVLIVGSRGPIEINPRDTMAKETSIVGVALMATTKDELDEMSEAIQAGIEDGWIDPVVAKEAAEAHRDIVNSTGATGKLVLTIDS